MQSFSNKLAAVELGSSLVRVPDPNRMKTGKLVQGLLYKMSFENTERPVIQ
jgi:hypothetical protein